MITVNLNDKNLAENLRAIRELQQTGLFTDEQLQEMYDRQLEKDRNREGADDDL